MTFLAFRVALYLAIFWQFWTRLWTKLAFAVTKFPRKVIKIDYKLVPSCVHDCQSPSYPWNCDISISKLTDCLCSEK